MLKICGKTLLEHQIHALNNSNLKDITVIAGYGRDQMRADGITILENPDFKNGSVLNTLFVGKEKMIYWKESKLI